MSLLHVEILSEDIMSKLAILRMDQMRFFDMSSLLKMYFRIYLFSLI